MENPFKKIIEDKELPDLIKEKVINDVNLIKLTLEMSELFLVNLPNIVYKFFTTDNPDTTLPNTTNERGNNDNIDPKNQ